MRERAATRNLPLGASRGRGRQFPAWDAVAAHGDPALSAEHDLARKNGKVGSAAWLPCLVSSRPIVRAKPPSRASEAKPRRATLRVTRSAAATPSLVSSGDPGLPIFCSCPSAAGRELNKLDRVRGFLVRRCSVPAEACLHAETNAETRSLEPPRSFSGRRGGTAVRQPVSRFLAQSHPSNLARLVANAFARNGLTRISLARPVSDASAATSPT